MGVPNSLLTIKWWKKIELFYLGLSMLWLCWNFNCTCIEKLFHVLKVMHHRYMKSPCIYLVVTCQHGRFYKLTVAFLNFLPLSNVTQWCIYICPQLPITSLFQIVLFFSSFSMYSFATLFNMMLLACSFHLDHAASLPYFLEKVFRFLLN